MKSLKLLSAVLLLGSAANASIINYYANLNGANEVGPVVTNGIGTAYVTIDTVAQTMSVTAIFSGLTGTTTASHIHCCQPLGTNAGVATTTPFFAGFPIGVTNGVYNSGALDLTAASTYNPTFVTAQGSVANAEAALLAGLANGQSYFNIHSSFASGGEIRGQLALAPEPTTFVLSGLALAGLAFIRRRKAA